MKSFNKISFEENSGTLQYFKIYGTFSTSLRTFVFFAYRSVPLAHVNDCTLHVNLKILAKIISGFLCFTGYSIKKKTEKRGEVFYCAPSISGITFIRYRHNQKIETQHFINLVEQINQRI